MQKTKELQRLWWDWLGTSERLLRSLAEQTAALTLRDVARVERIQPELDSMLERMKKIDELAATSARRLAEELGAEPSLRGLVGALQRAEAQSVQGLANRVKAAATNVSEALERNRRLIDNELTYVTGTLALIAKVANEHDNKYGTSPQQAVLLDQVA